MSCSLRLPRAPPEAATPPLTTPPTCLLSAEAARVVVSLSACLSACQSPFLSLCLLFASSATSRVFCVRFEASCKLAASSVLRRFVALFNLDKLKTMPQTPHTLLQLPTLCSSCMRQGSCRLRPPPGSPPLPHACLLQPSATSCVYGECRTCPMQHTCHRCGSN